MKSYRDVVSSSPIVSPVCIAELVKEAIKTESLLQNCTNFPELLKFTQDSVKFNIGNPIPKFELNLENLKSSTR